MLLTKLYQEYDYQIEVTGITTDSRFVQPGFLFIPYNGNNYLGKEFIKEAINKGASVIVYNEPLFNLEIPIIIVDDLHKELLRLLKLFYGEPYKELKTIGVTGTDGKTSIATLTSYLLNEHNKAANIGTNGIMYNNEVYPSLFTTLPLSENYRLMRLLKENDLSYFIMEVSSEGIVNGRIETLLFDYTIFSNLSIEHLNTHKTMTNYFQAKLELFKQTKPNGKMIVNKDDSHHVFFKDYQNVIYYSLFTPSDYQAINIRYYDNYTKFDLLTNDTLYKDILINRLEEYNIYNILPGIIICLEEGLYIPYIYERLKTLPIVPGRLEKVPLKYPFDVYVDFAHTPGGLKAVLSSLRRKCDGNLILVCGAAGNKDKTKRPLMGEIATELSDFVIFTSEDPRYENPLDIINQLTKDIKRTNYKIIINRPNALNFALRMAKESDIVIVTGKGRETFFEQGGIKIQYSDFDYLFNNQSLQK